MSSPLAIAGVTAVLLDLLNDGLINQDLAGVGTVKVSARPPDRVDTGTQEPNQLNLFLYLVTPNAGWRNTALPSLDGRGTARLSNPPLALDLHYLLTAFGQDDLTAEILLGYGMFLLHETPVLTRAAIRKTLTSPSPVSAALLPSSITGRNPADLADQVEQIKLTLQVSGAEEMSKLWTAMQARYRPSALYLASVVLIENENPVRSPVPVTKPQVTVSQFRRPFISAVEPQSVPAGGVLSVKGVNLKGDSTQVAFGELRFPIVPGGDQRVDVTLPAGLRSGVNTVQLMHDVDLGVPPVPHPGAGLESNVVAFMLAPRITNAPPLSVARGGKLTVGIAPPVASEQRVALLVGDRALALPARLSTDPPANSLDFTIPADFPTGSFLLRVQVDGAQSPLQIDTNPASPTFNSFIGPKVAVT
jgi:hypothetical protein